MTNTPAANGVFEEYQGIACLDHDWSLGASVIMLHHTLTSTLTGWGAPDVASPMPTSGSGIGIASRLRVKCEETLAGASLAGELRVTSYDSKKGRLGEVVR